MAISAPSDQPAHTPSETLDPYPTDPRANAVKLFSNDANQAVRISKDFELRGTDAVMHRKGNRLILELVPDKPKKGTPAALLLVLDLGED